MDTFSNIQHNMQQIALSQQLLSLFVIAIIILVLVTLFGHFFNDDRAHPDGLVVTVVSAVCLGLCAWGITAQLYDGGNKKIAKYNQIGNQLSKRYFLFNRLSITKSNLIYQPKYQSKTFEWLRFGQTFQQIGQQYPMTYRAPDSGASVTLLATGYYQRPDQPLSRLMTKHLQQLNQFATTNRNHSTVATLMAHGDGQSLRLKSTVYRNKLPSKIITTDFSSSNAPHATIKPVAQ